MSATNDLGQWYKSIPPITRAWFTASIATSIAPRIGLIKAQNLILFVEPIIYKFQIWRLLTAVLFYPMGFNFLINLFFLYQYSSRLESSTFDGKTADYVFCLFFLWLCNIVVGSILSLYVLMDAMILSVMYIWCQLNKETMMSFWFGMQFKAMYMPWVIMVFNWIISGSFLVQLCGIVIGHLYYFLVFKYPQDFGGASFLQTPSFLYWFFPLQRSGIGNYGSTPIPRRQAGEDENAGNRGRQAFGGRGNVLGTQ